VPANTASGGDYQTTNVHISEFKKFWDMFTELWLKSKMIRKYTLLILTLTFLTTLVIYFESVLLVSQSKIQVFLPLENLEQFKRPNSNMDQMQVPDALEEITYTVVEVVPPDNDKPIEPESKTGFLENLPRDAGGAAEPARASLQNMVPQPGQIIYSENVETIQAMEGNGVAETVEVESMEIMELNTKGMLCATYMNLYRYPNFN